MNTSSHEAGRLTVIAGLRAMVTSRPAMPGSRRPTSDEIQAALKQQLSDRGPQVFEDIEDAAALLPDVMGIRLHTPFFMTDLIEIQEDLITAVLNTNPADKRWKKARRFYQKQMDLLQTATEELDEKIDEALKISDRQQRAEALRKFLQPATVELLIEGRPPFSEALRRHPEFFFTQSFTNHR